MLANPQLVNPGTSRYVGSGPVTAKPAPTPEWLKTAVIHLVESSIELMSLFKLVPSICIYRPKWRLQYYGDPPSLYRRLSPARQPSVWDLTKFQRWRSLWRNNLRTKIWNLWTTNVLSLAPPPSISDCVCDPVATRQHVTDWGGQQWSTEPEQNGLLHHLLQCVPDRCHQALPCPRIQGRWVLWSHT